MEAAAAAMDAAVDKLHAELSQAQANVGSTWAIFGEGKSLAQSSLDKALESLSSLEDVLMPRVLSGSYTYAAWADYAAAVHAQIAAADSSVGSWSFTAVAAGVASSTAKDIKDDVKLGALVGLPLLALVAVAIILVKVGR